jgi:hypothetical protein
MVVSFSILTGRLRPAAALIYETTPICNSEPQNIEQEISNDEVWNRCAQSFLKNNNDSIPYFDIRYSLFDIRYLSASGGFAFSKFFSIRPAVFMAGG